MTQIKSGGGGAHSANQRLTRLEAEEEAGAGTTDGRREGERRDTGRERRTDTGRGAAPDERDERAEEKGERTGKAVRRERESLGLGLGLG